MAVVFPKNCFNRPFPQQKVEGHYELLVEAWDGGADPRRSRLTLSITVLDVDDNAPEFTQRAYVVDLPENIPRNTAILQLQVREGAGPGGDG